MSAIKPIRTAADYQQALARIESIFEAAPGTAEFDELDVLTTLVQAYDAVHHPIPEPDPIEYIKYKCRSKACASATWPSGWAGKAA